MNIEDKLFDCYEIYLKEHSNYSPNVYNDTPQTLEKFPTVLFLEENAKNNSITRDKVEYTETLRYVVEIYTKNDVFDDEMIARKEIANELRMITHDFFRKFNMKLTSDTKAEYLDFNIYRRILIAECNVNSWDGKLR